MVPFGAYAGQNSGIPIEPLTQPEFRARANDLFGLSGGSSQGRTPHGWLRPDSAPAVLSFALQVADAYRAALPFDVEGTQSEGVITEGTATEGTNTQGPTVD
jgi:hypothetical protein